MGQPPGDCVRVVPRAVAPHAFFDMADPAIQLDEQGELFVGHIRVVVGVGYAELATSGG